MIDWFVLLVPLMVLPIVLLLVFVGCVLDRMGGKEPSGTVTFTYAPGLTSEPPNLPKAQSFVVTWSGSLGGSLNPIQRGGDSDMAIDNAGETITAGDVGADSDGGVMCICNIVASVPPDDPAPLPAIASSTEKAEGVDAPSFTLVRSGDSFAIV